MEEEEAPAGDLAKDKSKGTTQEQSLAVEMPSDKDSAVKVDLKLGGIDRQWAVGDLCRAVFHDDNLEYEATVQSVETDGEGNPYAYVRSEFYY